MGGGIRVLWLISSERECEEFYWIIFRSVLAVIFKSNFYFNIY
jgi:hypothetical protein